MPSPPKRSRRARCQWTHALVTLAAVCALAACGGGGGGGAVDPAAPTPPATPNQPPTARTGVELQAVAGVRVVLDGRASIDPDGEPISFAWTLSVRPAGSSAQLSEASASQASFMPDQPGRYVARLVVSDGSLSSAPAEQAVVAVAANVAPTADAGRTQSVVVGSAVRLDGRTSNDADGDALSFAWRLSARPPGSAAGFDDAASAQPAFTADRAGTYVATLVVSDANLSSAASSVSIVASVGNAPPLADPGRDRSVLAGSVVALDGSASTDANGDALSYAWSMASRPAGSGAALSDPSAVRPSFTADVAGRYTLRLVVSDGQAASAATQLLVDALPTNAPPGHVLVWSDEFDQDGLPDPTRWDYDTDRNRAGWYNNELQYYARDRAENARVSGGRLVITARKEALDTLPDWGGQAYSSARLVTRGKASWTYGFFEIRARLPCGAGTWPAIWTLGTRGTWPDDGEIDIMEQVGSDPTRVFGTVHTALSGGPGTGGEIRLADACSAFHDYQLTWSKDEILIGVDNLVYYRAVNPGVGYRGWPFDFAQYLLLNIAIGGTLGGAVDDAIFPVTLEVDHVRVFQKP